MVDPNKANCFVIVIVAGHHLVVKNSIKRGNHPQASIAKASSVMYTHTHTRAEGGSAIWLVQ